MRRNSALTYRPRWSADSEPARRTAATRWPAPPRPPCRSGSPPRSPAGVGAVDHHAREREVSSRAAHVPAPERVRPRPDHGDRRRTRARSRSGRASGPPLDRRRPQGAPARRDAPAPRGACRVVRSSRPSTAVVDPHPGQAPIAMTADERSPVNAGDHMTIVGPAVIGPSRVYVDPRAARGSSRAVALLAYDDVERAVVSARSRAPAVSIASVTSSRSGLRLEREPDRRRSRGPGTRCPPASGR